MNMSMDGQQNNVAYDFRVPVQPVAAAAWRGRFNIPSKNIDINITAHVSNKACMKVLEVANMMPESIYLETVPRLDVWPLSFESSPPTEHSIALFFFPEGRDEEVLDSLITEAIYTDFALRAMIGKTELLIFPSHQLPDKRHRFLGKHYLWGVFRGQQAPSNQSDFRVQVQNTKARQTLYSNSDDHRSFEGCSPIAISSKHSPSTHPTKPDRRGRHLDDGWVHARPLDELRQKAECRYCGFISSHGGISRLKAHLGGGNATVHLPGCDKVPPDLKQAMADWFNEWVRNTKAVWARGIKVEPEEPNDTNGRPLAVWEHAKPFDETGRQRTETKYLNFGSLDGAMLQHKVETGLRDQKTQLDAWPKVAPKVKNGSSKKSKTSKPHEIKGLMSEWANCMTSPKIKSEGDQQAERRGRPLDDAWKHAKALDAARQKTQCNYCGFVSSYGGISRLKAHLGGGSSEMQLQACPRVSLEVKTIMEQWFDEWAKTSSAAWTKKSYGGGPVKSYKRSRSVDIWEHAMLMDELGQATKCKYCGFVSKCGGIERLKAHLGGGDQAMQLEGCPNVSAEIRSSIVKEIKKYRKKAKGVHMENLNGVFQAGEMTPSNTQWNNKRHHILQETMDEIANSSLKGSLQKLIHDKNAKVQKMQYEIQALGTHLARMP